MRPTHFTDMLTEVLEYGYEGLIKAAKQNFNTFLNASLVFSSHHYLNDFKRSLICILMLCPCSTDFYHADTEAISVTEVSSPRKAKIYSTFIRSPMILANKTFILSKKPFSISKCINKEYMRGIK